MVSVQQAFPQTNHTQAEQSSPQADRKEASDNGVLLAPCDDARCELEERVRRCSSDYADGGAHRNGQPAVIQVTLPPEQNGNVVYQRGFVSQGGSEKHVQRKNMLAQVEQWVKVQKGDPQQRSFCFHTIKKKKRLLAAFRHLVAKLRTV